jgi:hypothetical protein
MYVCVYTYAPRSTCPVFFFLVKMNTIWLIVLACFSCGVFVRVKMCVPTCMLTYIITHTYKPIRTHAHIHTWTHNTYTLISWVSPEVQDRQDAIDGDIIKIDGVEYDVVSMYLFLSPMPISES